MDTNFFQNFESKKPPAAKPAETKYAIWVERLTKYILKHQSAHRDRPEVIILHPKTYDALMRELTQMSRITMNVHPKLGPRLEFMGVPVEPSPSLEIGRICSRYKGSEMSHKEY